MRLRCARADQQHTRDDDPEDGGKKITRGLHKTATWILPSAHEKKKRLKLGW